VELLCAYEDELVVLAMDALVALALPPLSHRCNLDMSRHTTVLHKNAAHFDPLFEIIEASLFSCAVPVPEFLSTNFAPTPEMKTAKVDFRTRSKYLKSVLISDSNGETSEIETLLRPEGAVEVADVWSDARPLSDIVRNTAGKLTFGLRVSLMCSVRMRRLVQTRAGRVTVLRLQYQAAAIVLGCHPDANVLANYFEDKITLFKNFMYLLRTGPGTLDYRPSAVPLELRLLACLCLEAVVGARDNGTHSQLFTRYPWIVQDLGINRGQYMGLLPSMVRAMTSYLVALDGSAVSEGADSSAAAEESKMDVTSPTSAVSASSETAEDRDVRLRWIENVFKLLIAVVNLAAALPALCDNGLVGALLLVLDRQQVQDRTPARTYIEIMCIEALEGVFSAHAPALQSFKEKKGMEIVVTRLHRELHYCLVTSPPVAVPLPADRYHFTRCNAGTLPTPCSIIVQEFFTLLTSVIQEDRSPTSDHSQWYKHPALAQSLRLVFEHADKVGSLVLSPAVTLLAEVINSDSAPPTILSYMLNSGVCELALRVLAGNAADATEQAAAVTTTSAVTYSSDLVVSLLSLLQTVSLTADGIALIDKVNPFQALFALYADPRYVYPQSRVVMTDVPNIMGSQLEELVRHYPVYTPPVMTELVRLMKHVAALAEPYVGAENYRTGTMAFDAEYERVLHYAVALLLCLETLMLNNKTVEQFHQLGGFPVLGTFLRIGFGPPRYLLDSFSCTVDSTVNCIGYTPMVSLVVHRCMNRMGEVERKLLLQYLLQDLQSTVDTLESDLEEHSMHFNCVATGSSRHVPATVGGNGNPFMEGLLDTVTRDPVQDCCEEGQITDKLLSFTRVLRGTALTDCLVDALGIALNQRTTGVQWEECWAMFTSESSQRLVDTILNRLYIPSQLEMARARGMFTNSTKENCVKVHPVYHLLVVASESVVVKDGPEDTATRVSKLGRGCTVQAYERRCAGASGVLKYRTKDGWVSVFRTAQSTDPQLLVVRATKKTPEETAEEIAKNQGIYEDTEKRFEFEKFANVSAKRGGFLALYHFNHSAKTHLLSILTRNLFVREAVSGIVPQETCSVSPTAATTVPTLTGCVRALLADVHNPTSRTELDLETLLAPAEARSPGPNGGSSSSKGSSSSRKSRFARSNTHSSSVEAPLSAPSVTISNAVLKERFFQHDAVPLLDEFSTSAVYITIRLAELCHSLVFEQRRGRLELNPLVLAHLVYSGDTLERIFHATGKIFLCSLPDLALEAEDQPEHHHLYSGPWFPLKESELDSEAAEAQAHAAMDVDSATAGAAESSEGAHAAKAGKGRGKGKKPAQKTKQETKQEEKKVTAFTPFPSYLAYRRALRERRLLAVSSVDNTLNLWKLICSTLTSPSTSTEKALQRDATDERDFDPVVMKRTVLTTMCKYLVQVWSHNDLHLLPPTTVKNVVDLMAVVIKSLSDHKAVSTLRSPLPATTPTAAGSSGAAASGGAHGEMARLLNRLGAARRIPTANAGAQAPPQEFVVSEDCINTLQEMGFSRRAIVRAATMLRSNNANHIVPHLLENPFYFDAPDPTPALRATSNAASAPAASSSAEPSASAAPVAVSSASESTAAAGSSTAATTEGPQPSAEELLLAAVTAAGPAPARSGRARAGSVSKAATHSDAPPHPNPLPPIPKQLDVTLKLERDLLQRVLKCIYGDVPSLCVRLIERGPTTHLELLDTDMKTANTSVSRELFTVMVLNHMLKCLEKNNLPDGLLRIVQLSWLYHRAVATLKEGAQTEETYGTLFGLLHAILVLLTSKINSSNKRAPSTCSEMVYLIFTLDDRYNKLYPMLVDALDQFARSLHSAQGSQTTSASSTGWIAPALLILDIAAQPILVDAEALRSSMSELDGYVRYNPQSSVMGEGAGITTAAPDDAILSEQVRSLFNKKFLGKKTHLFGFPSIDDMLFAAGSGRQRPHGRSFDGLFEFDFGPALGGSPIRSGAAVTSSAKKGKGRGKGKTASKDTPQQLLMDSPQDQQDEEKKANETEAALPLFDGALSGELKMRALSAGISLLSALSNSTKSEDATITQAAMQIIAHLTRTPAMRKVFHDQQGARAVLRCKTTFEGMASVVFTLLQQVLEDEKYLAQSMITAVRLCLLRLSERKAKSVPLKNFLEVICPVVLREQALFMRVLKEHTVLKDVSGQVFISWKDAAADSALPALPAATVAGAGQDDATSAAAKEAAAAVAPVASAAKRQRLGDGSAVTTSTVQSASKPPLPTSGLKSGAKRVLSSLSSTDLAAAAPVPSAAVTSSGLKLMHAPHHHETINGIVDELLSRIVCKWLQVKTMDKEGNTAISADSDAVDTSLTIEDMLIIAADLIAAQPAVSMAVMRYVYNVARAPAWAKATAKKEFPLAHVISGQALGGLFVTFVVHALLLPARLVSWDLEPAAANDASAAQLRQTRQANIAKLTGNGLRNACSYFLASLASRPGESRKRVLSEVLNGANAGITTASRTAQLRSFVAFAETLQYLLSPPASWTSRDAFILPAKDILATLTKLNAHARIGAAICAIDMAHPLALETVMVLSVPLDAVIKKGLEPGAHPAPAAVSEPAKPPLHPLGIRYAEANRESRDSRDTRGVDAAPIAPVSSTSALADAAAVSSTTPVLRRSLSEPPLPVAAEGSAVPAASAGDASRAFVTPATNRRRGNTDQSFDTEERQLLLQTDQHEHLLRPASYRHGDDDGDVSGDEGDHMNEAEVDAMLDGVIDGGGSEEDEDDGIDSDEDEVSTYARTCLLVMARLIASTTCLFSDEL
jgi:hypothetical protein